MLDLRRGDRAPIVAACQALLNAHAMPGGLLDVDGVYGGRTEHAVRGFQGRVGLSPTGDLDPDTWSALSGGGDLRVFDTVDVFDPTLHESRAVLESYGARPSIVGGMCNGVGALRSRMRIEGVSNGKLVLLRFHGHGNRGVQAVAYGTSVQLVFEVIRGEPMPSSHAVPNPDSVPPEQLMVMALETAYSGLSLRSIESFPEVAAYVRGLAPFFHRFGSIEFHGCQVGGGTKGRMFLRRMADLVGVPAVAAQQRQLTGNAVRYSGPVEIAVPGGGSLEGWARSLPEVEQCR